MVLVERGVEGVGGVCGYQEKIMSNVSSVVHACPWR